MYLLKEKRFQPDQRPCTYIQFLWENNWFSPTETKSMQMVHAFSPRAKMATPGKKKLTQSTAR